MSKGKEPSSALELESRTVGISLSLPLKHVGSSAGALPHLARCLLAVWGGDLGDSAPLPNWGISPLKCAGLCLHIPVSLPTTLYPLCWKLRLKQSCGPIGFLVMGSRDAGPCPLPDALLCPHIPVLASFKQVLFTDSPGKSMLSFLALVEAGRAAPSHPFLSPSRFRVRRA